MLYSWHFSRYSAPIHWLVHGHMTSNIKTVSRQIPWAGNIVKTMTSNGKQFTVTCTCEMLTAVAHDCWNLIVVFKYCFCFVLLYNKWLVPWGTVNFVSVESQCFPRRFSGNKIHCPPRDQSLSVKCLKINEWGFSVISKQFLLIFQRTLELYSYDHFKALKWWLVLKLTEVLLKYHKRVTD